MDRDPASAYAAALDAVLQRAHLMPPDALDELTVLGARHLGASTAVLWLVDYEQTSLSRLGGPTGVITERLSVDGSVAGRCFRSVEALETDSDGVHRLWVPLLDGLERLGVLEVVLDEGSPPLTDELRRELAQLGHLLAELLVSNSAYTDHYEWARRRQAMSLPAEMQHRLLPPLTFGTERVVISGLLAPAYEVGGDAFDYALNGNLAHVAVFDAVGHGLQASLLANLAVSCYRNTRRAGLDLAAAAATIDQALDAMFGGERFVTAMLGQLDVDTGVFRWINAGHPAAMLVRHGQVVKEVEGRPALPLGINGLLAGAEAFPVSSEALQPGDRLLLLTDGVDEARNAEGEFFGRQRLAEFAAKEASSGLPTPEAMRRLQQAVLRHQVGRLQDDATIVFVEWLTGVGQQMQPGPA
ncbi:MAG: serine/threonine-protein phosphatase [Actinomycetota bacterium]|nr:serine/threonine-protein phosphatase [Actinomycetota bacterium]